MGVSVSGTLLARRAGLGPGVRTPLQCHGGKRGENPALLSLHRRVRAGPAGHRRFRARLRGRTRPEDHHVLEIAHAVGESRPVQKGGGSCRSGTCLSGCSPPPFPVPARSEWSSVALSRLHILQGSRLPLQTTRSADISQLLQLQPSSQPPSTTQINTQRPGPSPPPPRNIQPCRK